MNAHADEHRALPFADYSGRAPRKPEIWPPCLVTREAIDAEIRRLAALPAPANGRRMSKIVHPASRTANSFSPAADVSLQVLLPGESTVPSRTNANQLEISIRGRGTVQAGTRIEVEHHDVWTIPPMQVHAYLNDGDDLWVRLTYSNAPLLELIGTLLEEEGGELREGTNLADDGLTDSQRLKYAWENAPDIELTPAGARLRGYEFLTDIPVLEHPPLHWPWKLVAPYKSRPLDEGGRNIWLLYHPATERRNGTTNSFFATIGGCPAGTPVYAGKHGHRHMSASINYHMAGHGYSVVDGVRVDWKAGDLLLSAPSWSEHAHFHGAHGWTVLTVQDHPLHIAMGSLLWQEKFDGPILALGAQSGQKGYIGPRAPGA